MSDKPKGRLTVEQWPDLTLFWIIKLTAPRYMRDIVISHEMKFWQTERGARKAGETRAAQLGIELEPTKRKGT